MTTVMSLNKDNDVMAALKRWMEICEVQDRGTGNLYAFATFLGHPFDGKTSYIINLENPEVARKIKLINGPDGDTILKMMKIQKEKQSNADPKP